MAEVSQAIQDKLANTSGVSNLVAARIYPLKAPPSPTAPYLTFFRVDALRDGSFSADNGMVDTRYQIDSWASTYAGATDLAAAVRAALQRWGGVTQASVVVLDTRLENEDEEFDDEVDLYRVSQDYVITTRE